MLMLISPREIDAITLERILFVESGALLLVMLYLKGVVSVRIYRRMRDQSHFHYSFFGKKVVHPSVVTSKDLFIYFLTIPDTGNNYLWGVFHFVSLLRIVSVDDLSITRSR